MDDLLADGATRYIQRLRNLAVVNPSPELIKARAALIDSLEAALSKRTSLIPDDVSYDAGLYLPLRETGEWRHLDNQWTGGLGSTSPRVIAMGTEAASDPYDAMAAWSSGATLIDLSGGSWAIAAHLASGLTAEPWPRFAGLTADLPPPSIRPDLFLQRMTTWKLRPRHTWSLLADVVGAGRGNLASLFESTYLIERSVYVSKRSSGGLPPSTERTVFLAELVRTLAKSAECLLIYGSTNHLGWTESPEYSNNWYWANREVSKAFLGVGNLDAPAVVESRSGSTDPQPIAVFESKRHRVIWCRALSGQNVTDAYVNAVCELVSADDY